MQGFPVIPVLRELFPFRMISDTRIRVSICKFAKGSHPVRADWLGPPWSSAGKPGFAWSGWISIVVTATRPVPCSHFGISRQTFYRWQRRYDPFDLSRWNIARIVLIANATANGEKNLQHRPPPSVPRLPNPAAVPAANLIPTKGMKSVTNLQDE